MSSPADGRPPFTRSGAGAQQSRWRLGGHAAGAGTSVWSQGRFEMPTAVKLGQTWSVWVPDRRQWLLSTVIRRENGCATLGYDTRHGAGQGHNRQDADESTMLAAPNLFRFIDPQSGQG
jgi:hypothetical protein